MIKSRPRNADGLAVTIKPAVADPAIACSISLASRASTSSNPAHAFHFFQLASNSALAWSSVATPLSARSPAAPPLAGNVKRPEPAQIGGRVYLRIQRAVTA